MLERWMGTRLFWFTLTTFACWVISDLPFRERLAVSITVALFAVLGDYYEGRQREKHIMQLVALAKAEEVIHADSEEEEQK